MVNAQTKSLTEKTFWEVKVMFKKNAHHYEQFVLIAQKVDFYTLSNAS